MKKYLLFLILLWIPVTYADQNIPIKLENITPNIHDKKSIERGAKFFATTCMVCHTLIYLRYDKFAQQNGVVYDKMPLNVKEWPFNVKPPDLSLEINRRGADWVYTYLHSFYSDTSRPTGSNNLLVPNTVMTPVLMPLQGQQILLPAAQFPKKTYHEGYEWYDLLSLQTQGSMTPEQFDATIMDVVNFLAYAAEPYKVKQEKIGVWVIGFLLIFFVLTYLLKRAYWRNVHK